MKRIDSAFIKSGFNIQVILLLIALITIIQTGCSGGGQGTSSSGNNGSNTGTSLPSITSVMDSGVTSELDLSSYGRCEDVWADGNYTYMAAKDGGVIVVNTADPGKPVYVTKYKTYGEAWELFKDGNYLYVADKNGGLAIIDVKDPNYPNLTGRDNPSGIHGDAVFKSGNYVYWTGGDGSSGYFMVTGVSAPQSPVNKATKQLFSNNSGSSIWVEENIAYTGDARGNFYTVNISNPENPVISGTLKIGDNNSSAYDLIKRENYIYMANGSQGLCIIDIKDPAKPIQTGRYTISDNAYDVRVDGNFAYVAFGWGGLMKVDISDPSKPSEVSKLADPKNASFHSISLNGDYAYLADNGRQYLVIIKYK